MADKAGAAKTPPLSSSLPRRNAGQKTAAATSPSAAPHTADTLPEPGAMRLKLTLMTLGSGTILHRVHLQRYQATQFNPGQAGNARFSPIQDALGNPIPTLYASTSIAGALMETIFHDVPHTPDLKTLDRQKLHGQVHSQVLVQQPLQLVDLANVPLRKLGISRRQLIDTEKNQYPSTRKWAAAIHHQCPEAQGLSWVSRQDDTTRAFMLFGDRIAGKTLRQDQAPRSLLHDESTHDAVLDLAERIGVAIVPGMG